MEETWELAVVSWEILASLLISGVLLIVLVVAAIALFIVVLVKSEDLISNPLDVAVNDLDTDEKSRNILREKLGAYQSDGRFRYMASGLGEEAPDSDKAEVKFDDVDREFVSGRGIVRTLTKDEIAERERSFFEFRKKFEIEHSGLVSELKSIKKRQKIPRFLIGCFVFLVAILLLVAVSGAFLFSSSYFGVGAPFKTERQELRESDERGAAIGEYLSTVESSANKLVNAGSLTVDEISAEAGLLKRNVSALQNDLNKQIEATASKRVELSQRVAEFETRIEQFEAIQSMRQEEFDAVKSLIFEETINSSRRYWLLGLISSIPLFWLSEILKYWLFRLIGWMRVRSSSGAERKLSLRREKV